MYSRRDTVEIFSTFLRLDGDRDRGWQTDPSLRRSITRCIALYEAQEREQPVPLQFWTSYWQRLWQEKPNSPTARLAIAHLSAYLQETCYWSAKKMRATLKISSRVSFFNSNYQVSDYFQIAIASTPKILKSYNPERSNSLDDYARVVFRSSIQETLRKAREVDFCSDWGLLRKLSKRSFWEVLQEAGFSEEAIARYQLAWTCFKTVYQPTRASGTRHLNAPDLATWDAIAAAYHRERPLETVSPETLKTWLLECARFARASFYPSQVSLNEPRSSLDVREPLDELSLALDSSLLKTWIESEEQDTRSQRQIALNRLLFEAIYTLDPKSQEILQLYYRQGLMQNQIAERLDLKQYQVSRQLSRTRKTLLKAIAQWSQKTFKIALSSSTLAAASQSLDEWLQGDYARNTQQEDNQNSLSLG